MARWHNVRFCRGSMTRSSAFFCARQFSHWTLHHLEHRRSVFFNSLTLSFWHGRFSLCVRGHVLCISPADGLFLCETPQRRCVMVFQRESCTQLSNVQCQECAFVLCTVPSLAFSVVVFQLCILRQGSHVLGKRPRYSLRSSPRTLSVPHHHRWRR